jgi:hypothetical protein
MGRLLPFRRRPFWTGEPPRGQSLTFANKLQILVLNYPAAARIVEALVERLLTEIANGE